VNGEFSQLLPAVSFFGHLTASVACASAALWIARRGDNKRSDNFAAILAATMTGLWSALAAALGPFAPLTELASTVRDLALIYFVFRLFANDGRATSMGPIRWVVLSLGFVTLLQPVLLLVATRFAFTPEIAALTFSNAVLLKMLVAIGALVLLHNLYAGAAAPTRQLLRWSAIGLAGIWIFEFNLFAIAYLSGDAPVLLLAIRGFAIALLMVFVALGSSPAAVGLQFSPSRTVTFQTLSLIVIGAYLLAMIFVAQSLPVIGGDFGRIAQVSFLVLASLAALVWLPSRSTLGWLRVTATKHLFQHRYDYRNEWLRFTRTISQVGEDEQSFHQRAVKAMADLTGSPAGLLLVPNEQAELELVARWQWKSIEVPAIAATYQLAGILEEGSFILDLDALREGGEFKGEKQHVPAWLLDAPNAWAVAPLLHFDRLVGAVVLARPVDGRRLDWEDFDLLRVVGQQLASYLAEQSSQQALLEANRFDEFNRRIAFVMHDIKNLASQLSLLARNAEKHADKPEFRADMLVTLSNSADKLNALLARLGRYGGGDIQNRKPVDLAALARRLAQRFRATHPVEALCTRPCMVEADAEALEQALVHLVQNAIDASEADSPVYIDARTEGVSGIAEIVDAGQGMTPGFIRDGLFKPFVSSKNGGFGIGAFEARELVRAMGGRLNVESREGLGTRFIVNLPLCTRVEDQSDNSASQNEVA